MDIKEKIESIVSPLLERFNAFIVDIHVLTGEKRKIVQLFVDTDTGITINQCEEISRIVDKVFENENLIQGSYILQVSSPGLDKPLKLLRQYKKNIGRRFKVKFKENDNIREIIGIIKEIDGDYIIFSDDEGKKFSILFSNIIEAVEELPW